MSNLNYTPKVFLSVTSLMMFMANTAYAGGTAADTLVSNTFTLNFSVNNSPQPEINNAAPGSETTFRVDRLIDLTVTATQNTTTAPNQSDAELRFTVTNDGNDTQGYLLSLVNASGDDFDTTGLEIFFLDSGGSEVTYNPSVDGGVPILAADAMATIIIRGDIPSGTADGETSDVILIASTTDDVRSGTSYAALVNDNDGADIDVTENVFADDDADGTGTNDAVTNGADLDTATFTVATALISGNKTVSVFSENGAGCGTFPGTSTGGYAVPGSCMEYVITVNNSDTRDATDVSVVDNLPAGLSYVAAETSGFFQSNGTTALTAFTAEPAPTDTCDGTASGCQISITNAVLPAGDTGTITIRMTINNN